VSLKLVAATRVGRQMTLLHERYEPGAGTGEEMLAHKGEEGGVVVRGRIEVTVGNETRVLGPGEAYYFASNLPHRFRNPGARSVRDREQQHAPQFLIQCAARWRRGRHL
jgi:mannose-6-phosphate isomerase-like protein (cupin superfamily)